MIQDKKISKMSLKFKTKDPLTADLLLLVNNNKLQ